MRCDTLSTSPVSENSLARHGLILISQELHAFLFVTD